MRRPFSPPKFSRLRPSARPREHQLLLLVCLFVCCMWMFNLFFLFCFEGRGYCERFLLFLVTPKQSLDWQKNWEHKAPLTGPPGGGCAPQVRSQKRWRHQQPGIRRWPAPCITDETWQERNQAPGLPAPQQGLGSHQPGPGGRQRRVPPGKACLRHAPWRQATAAQLRATDNLRCIS